MYNYSYMYVTYIVESNWTKICKNSKITLNLVKLKPEVALYRISKYLLRRAYY